MWSEKNIFQFLKSPQTFIKGVKCEIPNQGLSDENERADLARFLKLFTKQLYINQRVKANKLYGKDYVQQYEISQKRISEENFRRLGDLRKDEQKR